MARTPAAKKTAQEKPKQKASTVKMRRDVPIVEGGPTECDVHPDEVENWAKAGWKAAE